MRRTAGVVDVVDRVKWRTKVADPIIAARIRRGREDIVQKTVYTNHGVSNQADVFGQT